MHQRAISDRADLVEKRQVVALSSVEEWDGDDVNGSFLS